VQVFILFRLAVIYQVFRIAEDHDAWQQHRSDRSSSRFMGSL
jgi:hypothetical protein